MADYPRLFAYGDVWGTYLNRAEAAFWTWVHTEWRNLDQLAAAPAFPGDRIARRGHNSPSAKAAVVFKALWNFSDDAVDWCQRIVDDGGTAFTPRHEADVIARIVSILDSTIQTLGDTVRSACECQKGDWRSNVEARFADRRRAHSRSQGDPTGDDLPSWDDDRNELTYKGAVVRKIRKIAKNSILILQVFEEEGWPARIDSPLGPDQKLAEAIRTLNCNLDVLRFQGDGSGEGIVWVVAK